MRFIGDIHAQFDTYLELIKDCPESIQVGDFGAGFAPMPNMSPFHGFIRGNHDDPALCKAHPNYLGDVGYTTIDSIFFMSGAWSVDHAQRTIGRDWWEDEELSYDGLTKAIDLYEEYKPKTVVTHDCPASVSRVLFDCREEMRSRTANALNTMFGIHKPKLWVFGHWHEFRDQVILGTRFVCVPSNSAIDIEI